MLLDPRAPLRANCTGASLTAPSQTILTHSIDSDGPKQYNTVKLCWET